MATWPIDPDVRRIAKRFGVDAALIQAVVKAEGNILKAVQCSLPNVTTREEALEVTCRSAAHAMSDFIKVSEIARDDFIDFWAERWAPRGVKNDPTDLNRHWPKNVKAFWK
jgi:hypothetical protein